MRQDATLKTVAVWRLKEALRSVFANTHDVGHAETELKAWISWARRSHGLAKPSAIISMAYLNTSVPVCPMTSSRP